MTLRVAAHLRSIQDFHEVSDNPPSRSNLARFGRLHTALKEASAAWIKVFEHIDQDLLAAPEVLERTQAAELRSLRMFTQLQVDMAIVSMHPIMLLVLFYPLLTWGFPRPLPPALR